MGLSRIVAFLLVLAAPAAAQPAAELVRIGEPAGLGRLVRPEGVRDAPLVVLLPDALGDDGRSEPYVDSLLARGIASLVLGLEDDAAAKDGPEPAAAPAALAPALAWALGTGIPAARIGVMGFGLGARAALEAAGALPAAALYPRCAGLAAKPGRAVILQGEADAAGCGGLDLPAGVAFRLMRDAGHAWDAPGAIWPSPGPILPDPAGGARLQAHPDLPATLLAAEFLADWFQAALGSGVLRAGH